MHNFAGLKTLRLRLDYEVFSQFNWAFLRRDGAHNLRLIKVTGHSAKLPHTLAGEPLELDFSENVFYAAFGLRIIELLRNSGCELIFRMRTLRNGGGFKLDERDYAVDVDGATKRYVCRNSGIVVEVDGCLITLQSSA
ncbi:hypothetical protein AAVH_18330 [Aphelenchoides avenae]|nr:hypothetical protein AAVH_18330 [Aphelenchus avenae]